MATDWLQIMEFTVHGDPKPQPRPRAFSRNSMVRVYDPSTAEGWKSLIAATIDKDFDIDQPIEGPVRLDLDFYMRRPASMMRKKDPEEPIRHTKKPDRDNLEKAVMDCMTQLSVWRDDSQVCAGEINKYYHAKDDGPGMKVVLSIPVELKD